MNTKPKNKLLRRAKKNHSCAGTCSSTNPKYLKPVPHAVEEGLTASGFDVARGRCDPPARTKRGCGMSTRRQRNRFLSASPSRRGFPRARQPWRGARGARSSAPLRVSEDHEQEPPCPPSLLTVSPLACASCRPIPRRGRTRCRRVTDVPRGRRRPVALLLRKATNSLCRNIGLLNTKLNSNYPVLAIDGHYLPQRWIKVISEHRRWGDLR